MKTLLLLLFISTQLVFSQHNNELYNNAALITINSGAEVHVWGDIYMTGSGGLLNNNGLIKVQGNSYSDSLFQQNGTGTYRIENSDTNKLERQFIQGNFAVRGGQAQIGANDGSFFNLELANDQGIVYLVADGFSVVGVENLVSDIRGSVDFNPPGSPVVNKIVTHDIGLTGALTFPVNGASYASVFGMMNSAAGNANFINNTITANGNMSSVDNAYIQGNLRRSISPTGGQYGYLIGLEPAPVGSQRGVQYNRIDFSANDYDVISGYFQSGSSNAGSPTIDCSGSIVNYWGGTDHGEWIFNDISGAGTGIYNMTVWPQDDNFITSSIWIITKDNVISGTPNGCGPTPVGLVREGFNGFSEFGLAAVISPLPVELIGINANDVDNHIHVKWDVASEINLSHYELERSEDGLNFTRITSLEAQGNSQSALSYQYDDFDVRYFTDYFYRLRSVDFDGSYQLSPIVSASIKNENLQFSTENIMIYPNPSTDQFNLAISSKNELDLGIIIYSPIGKVIEKKEIDLQKGNTIILFETESWASGVYLIELIDQQAGIRFTKRVIKR